MPTDIEDIIAALTPGRRREIEKAAALIAEEMTRQELRRARAAKAKLQNPSVWPGSRKTR